MSLTRNAPVTSSSPQPLISGHHTWMNETVLNHHFVSKSKDNIRPGTPGGKTLVQLDDDGVPYPSELSIAGS